jgi:hypothetical protein
MSTHSEMSPENRERLRKASRRLCALLQESRDEGRTWFIRRSFRKAIDSVGKDIMKSGDWSKLIDGDYEETLELRLVRIEDFCEAIESVQKKVKKG